MPGNAVDFDDATGRPTETESGRERSTISFPYNDLNDAIGIARAIRDNAGTSCTVDQLAGYMKQPATSGTFRLSISTARIFGLVDTGRGAVSLTDLGKQMVDPTQEGRARSQAFLRVPLYAAIFEKFKGTTIPPTKALEREMASLGVSGKQANRARQAFERSADQAGYFQHGKDRLVMPAFPENPIPPNTDEPKRNGSGGGGGDGGQHPLIDGLLKTLPTPDAGWPIERRARWLQTAAGIFDLIYKGNDEGKTISVKVTSSES